MSKSPEASEKANVQNSVLREIMGEVDLERKNRKLHLQWYNWGNWPNFWNNFWNDWPNYWANY